MTHPRDIGFTAAALPEFGPILKSWLELQVRYRRLSGQDDVTWIYGERASLSILAAAAWHSGGIALEEFSTDKKPIVKGSELPIDTSAHGRCDLFISIRGRDFLIEAKPSWPSLRGEAKARVAKTLGVATADARRTSTYSGARRLAAVLVAPHLPRAHAADSTRLVRQFVTDLESFPGCAAAWFFPSATRQFSLVNDGKSYPGAAVLIKALRRAS
jgi:hypothetical protein